MKRTPYLAALCVTATLTFSPAALAQQQASPGLPLDQYGCVPQQAYVPEAGGCVAIEGQTPGSDPQVINPDTGEELGPLSNFEEGSSEQYAAPSTVPLNEDGTCPEGFVTVNAPFCAQESPNTPGRVFGFGEGDSAPQTSAPTQNTAADTQATTALPATGGLSLALISGALLLGAGLVLRRP